MKNKNNENYSLSIEATEKILFQMKNCVCKIYLDDNNASNTYTGFFCKIPYNSNSMPVLITTNQILNQKETQKNKNIKLSINDEKKFININLDEKRQIFIDNNKLKVAIIEIKPNDNIKDYLEIDDSIINNKENNLYKKRFAYILHYPVAKNVQVTYGSTYELIGNNIFHYINLENLSCGSPILLLDNFKVIGINKSENYFSFNLATFIQYPIEKFNNNNTEELNELTIRYKVKEYIYKLKLFDNYFVTNNEKNCKLLISGKCKDLTEYYKYTFNELINDDTLEIKLIETKKIINMCQMFSNCQYLDSVPDFSEWNMENINDISNIFFNCSLLRELPDISKWNTTHITNMGYVFHGCKSLKTLPDISKWNLDTVTDISNIFNDCSSLNALPDISKWNINNIYDISSIFSNCSSLISLPDISKWNTEKIIDMSNIFYNCSTLSILPDISKWNTNKVTTLSKMFYGCSSLVSLPDISVLKIDNITDISGLFYNCFSLVLLPDISKWNTHNITDMSEIFYGCKSLIKLPDISKWNTDNVTNISSLFFGCKSLSYLPDISKWNTNNFSDISTIFCNCSSLVSLPKISKWNTENVFFMTTMFNGCSSLSIIPDISKWNKDSNKDNNNSSGKKEGCLNLLNA